MKKFIYLIIIFISAQTVFPQTKAEKIDDLMNKYFEYKLFNGTLLVADKGEVILKKGYGYANFEFKVPLTPSTKFRIGSISKQFTATIILQLVEEGKISLDGKITDYLPDYRKDTGDKITIHHLLTHTSGIKSYTNIPNVWTDSLRNHYEKDYFIKHFHSGDLEFEPGTEFKYNNTGYYLLAAIAEEVTGEPFGELLQKRIFEPAGMADTGSETDETVVENEAQGYLKRGANYVRDPYLYMPNAMGAGSMYSTVEDLYKWDRILYTDKILSEEMKTKMFTPFLSSYGYGWAIRKTVSTSTGDSITIITHSGGINGFNTLEVRSVDENSFLAIFSNAGQAPFAEMMINIGKILDGQEAEYPKKPIGDYLYEVIQDEGIDEAISLYRQLKEEEKDTFDFSETQLNSLGYVLLREGRIEEAIALFELNAEMFPESSNVYDSLGEAFMEKGDNETAIKYYKKSIDLNPANQNGIDMLKKLGVDYKASNVTVSPEALKTYEGEYELMENFIITVRAEGSHLFAMATGQPEFEIFPLSEVKFYYKVVDAQIEFFENDAGEIEKLVLYQNNRVMPAVKIK